MAMATPTMPIVMPANAIACVVFKLFSKSAICACSASSEEVMLFPRLFIWLCTAGCVELRLLRLSPRLLSWF